MYHSYLIHLQDFSIQFALNKTIFHFSEDIKNYRFNTAVAKIRELSNELFKSDLKKDFHNFSWSIFLRLIYIITPHIAQELASIGGHSGFLSHLLWPVFDKSSMQSESVNIVVQLNGKKKFLVQAPINITKENLIDTIKKKPGFPFKYDKSVKKVIYVPNKILNIVK